LTPIDKTQPFFKVLLEIDKASSTIVGARVFEKNGTKYIYEISSFRPNVAINDSKFTFNKVSYPGVEIVDLR
jgi:outer membrane lipoprotein-sorting protein